MIELATSVPPAPSRALHAVAGARASGWWGIHGESASNGYPASNGQEAAAQARPGTAVQARTSNSGQHRLSAAPRPVSVVVIASDPITAEGTVAYLRSRPGITPLAPDAVDRADVVLMLATLMTEETLEAMRRIVKQARGREVSFVLVSGGVTAPKLLRVVSCGLVSVIPRNEADHERIVQAIYAVTRGRVELPGVALSGLGRVAAGLEEREVDVLRLLADGLDTIEIARRLCYSERTVKYIIHGMLSRLELRNRPHAVAFAMRNGLL